MPEMSFSSDIPSSQDPKGTRLTGHLNTARTAVQTVNLALDNISNRLCSLLPMKGLGSLYVRKHTIIQKTP